MDDWILSILDFYYIGLVRHRQWAKGMERILVQSKRSQELISKSIGGVSS